MPYSYTIDALNDICVDYGGNGGHRYNIDALNEWAGLLGSVTTHTLNIDAYNEICTLLGGTGGHVLNTLALDEIATLLGGTGGNYLNIDDLNEIVDLPVGGGGVSLTAPTLTWDTASSDNTPQFTVTFVSTPEVGDTVEFQIDDDPAFGSTSDTSDTVDAGEVTANDVVLTLAALADGTYSARARHVRGATVSDWSSTVTVTISVVADVTAPTLSSATGTETGEATADLSVTTDEGNGTLYAFVSTSSTPPTATDLKAGTGATYAYSKTVTATGAQAFSATGLSASTTYYAHFLHRDAAGNESSIVSSASFTTTAPAAVVIQLNFRGTSGYVTDDAGQTYVLGNDIYPTTRNGVTFGWERATDYYDRDNTGDPRLAGFNGSSNLTNPVMFRVDLPLAGTYDVDAGLGDTFTQSDITYEFQDNGTTKVTLGPVTIAGGHFIDIDGTDFADRAAWVAGHAPVSVVFSSTTFNLVMYGSWSVISHLSLTRTA